ncbi:MAG: hypothetical protein ACK4TA_18270 [Saprospiraceae bacterium]
MKIRIWLWLSGSLLLQLASAQQQIALSDYVLAKANDTLLYERSVGQEILVDTLIHTSLNIDNQLFTKRAMPLRGSRQEKLSEQGLAIYQINAAGGRSFTFEKPLHWLPKIITLRKIYKDSTQYKDLKDNALQGSGKIIIETNIEGFMSAETPLRNFVDCLSVSTKITLQNANGKRQITEWKDMYAKGIGLVQSIVRTQFIEAKGQASPLQITMLQLAQATIGGKQLEGRRRK